MGRHDPLWVRGMAVSWHGSCPRPLLPWPQENGAPEQHVEIQTVELQGALRPLDLVVARGPLKPGDVALRIPDNLIITLDRIFESEFVGEHGGGL